MHFGHQYDGTTFLEVGANFGVYCLPAVSELGFARAVAYEPDPASFELLEQNIERNGLGGSGQRSSRGAVGAAGRADPQPGQRATPATTGSSAPESGSGRATVKVPARKFDDEVAAGRIPLDDLGLVWLDVQGHEGEVLAGAESLLASKVPIVLEYSSGMLDSAATNGSQRHDLGALRRHCRPGLVHAVQPPAGSNPRR